MEIGVGEYVRTRKGIAKIKEKIGKVWDIGIAYEVDKNGTDIIDTSFNEFIYETDIIKHSKNILDLLEYDDFIVITENGYPLQIREMWENGGELNISLSNEMISEDIKNDKEFEIKQILTREMFEANVYRLEE